MEVSSPESRSRSTAVGDATRTRLMLAAERLIAARGIDGVSVRDITAAAETNSASIHYHFQSKEGLVLAIMEDLADRLRIHRLQYLAALDSKRPTCRQVAEAIVNPTFDFVHGDAETAERAYVGFLAAVLDDPSWVPAIERYFGDQYEAYFAVFGRARPDLPTEVLVNRVCFGLHLVLNTVSEPARGLRTWIERHCPTAVPVIRENLIEFLTGAFKAP